jgi:hypothetical protein
VVRAKEYLRASKPESTGRAYRSDGADSAAWCDAAARPALPAIVGPDGTVTCPILAGPDSAQARCLVADRFEAAIGLIDQEAAT